MPSVISTNPATRIRSASINGSPRHFPLCHQRPDPLERPESLLLCEIGTEHARDNDKQDRVQGTDDRADLQEKIHFHQGNAGE